MSNQSYQMPCIFCESSAIVKKTDYENRSWFKCSALDCGEYEISRSAIRLLGLNVETKKKLKEQAHVCVGTDKILEVIVSSENQLLIVSKSRSTL